MPRSNAALSEIKKEKKRKKNTHRALGAEGRGVKKTSASAELGRRLGRKNPGSGEFSSSELCAQVGDQSLEGLLEADNSPARL